MKNINRTFLVIAALVSPTIVFGAEPNSVNTWVKKILNSTTIKEAGENLTDAKKALDNFADYSGDKVSGDTKKEAEEKIKKAIENVGKDVKDVDPNDTRSDTEKAEDLQKLEDDYEAKKANEQSLANRTLTAVTTAATGIGGMELAMGLSEQKADKEANQNMAAYIATMKCTYADGKHVKAGPEEIQLPGSNQQILDYKNEYKSLAADLKIRKNALGMKAGIESEEILDKVASGLYDDENVGIESGAYASIYRAQMLGSEQDQAKLDEAAAASSKRVKAGAIAAGAGVLVGVAGNLLINGDLINKMKKDKNCKEIEKVYEKDKKSLDEFKTCLQNAKIPGAESLSFKYFQPRIISLKDLNCTELTKASDVGDYWTNTAINHNAQTAFPDTQDENEILTALTAAFGYSITGTMIGTPLDKGNENTLTTGKQKIKESFEKISQEYKDAIEKDEKSGCDSDFLKGLRDGIQSVKK